MIWKRVATAVVLMPLIVGLVVWGSTALVSVVVALVMLLALFEYFALGEAIGHGLVLVLQFAGGVARY